MKKTTNANKEKQIKINKKILISLLSIVLIIIAVVMLVNKKAITEYINQPKTAKLENSQAANEIGEKGKITSAQIIQTKTGTGPN